MLSVQVERFYDSQCINNKLTFVTEDNRGGQK